MKLLDALSFKLRAPPNNLRLKFRPTPRMPMSLESNLKHTFNPKSIHVSIPHSLILFFSGVVYIHSAARFLWGSSVSSSNMFSFVPVLVFLIIGNSEAGPYPRDSVDRLQDIGQENLESHLARLPRASGCSLETAIKRKEWSVVASDNFCQTHI